MKLTRSTLVRGYGQYASFPSLCVRDGGFWLAYRRAPDHRMLRTDTALHQVDHLDARSQITLQALDHSGVPVGAPRVLPPAISVCDQDPNLLRLRDGRLLLTGFSYYPLPASQARPLVEKGARPTQLYDTDLAYFFWGGYARTSDDDGVTWTPHQFFPHDPLYLDIIPDIRRWHGGPVRGRAVELADGTILQATYGGRINATRVSSELWESHDRGATFAKRATIAYDPAQDVGFCETALLQLVDGALLAVHRTSDAAGRLATSLSRDEGRSWDDAVVHDFIGHPSDLCQLADGRVLVVYGYRAKPYGIRARFWQDGSFGDEIVLVDDVPSPDCGYPWILPLDDGGALIAYYAADESGVRGIDAVRVSL
ncbi:sialidase family protein [Roseiterribacter gracilis]|uniref:Sialidase domain-containing protein n=1 Tax=Roseiterribacter gracilis TaxID=2812848 RepID=A0A8S8XC87_9PROT|nr:hypothetical protein TMPK1_16980 [Rhodospirillales bacterium TMPK1]